MQTIEFHFSPRPNRAAEIPWLAWGDDAFARARDEDKPILLAISAVWCHWCHVMDETTYSDDAVIEHIRTSFIPIRVDNDERPDINARYNMGGWPTTAFLAPDGTTITGATYLPPDRMARALDEIASFYHAQKDEIAQRAGELRTARVSYETSAPGALQADMANATIDALLASYDPEFGGFGTEPKFPQTDALELLAAHWRTNGDERAFNAVSHTLHAMASGGMYDRIEGGFFRYSTTRDWSVPHFEKMAEDNGGLIRVMAMLQTWHPDAGFVDTLRSSIGYVQRVLRDDESGLFGGSQDADEAYFARDLDARKASNAPFVDRRSYTNWSAGLAGAFAWASVALDDATLLTQALQTLDTLHDRGRDADGLLYHVMAPGEPPRVRGMLGDGAHYLRALLDTYEISGEGRLLERAMAYAHILHTFYGAADGGYYDHARIERLIGRLDVPDRPIGDNAIIADAFVRLSEIIGEDHWRAQAGRTLALYAKTFERAGSFAASYARAIVRFASPYVTVRVAGPVATTQALRNAARRLPTALTVVYTDPTGSGDAFVCRNLACAAPVREPSALLAAYESLIA